MLHRASILAMPAFGSRSASPPLRSTGALAKHWCPREAPLRRSSLQRSIVSHVLALATEAEKGVRYDEAEISRAYTRICCMPCSDWRADAVRAKVAAFLMPIGTGRIPSRHRPEPAAPNASAAIASASASGQPLDKPLPQKRRTQARSSTCAVKRSHPSPLATKSFFGKCQNWSERAFVWHHRRHGNSAEARLRRDYPHRASCSAAGRRERASRSRSRGNRTRLTRRSDVRFREQSGRHFLTGRVAPEWLYFFHHGASAAKSSPESLGHRSAVHAPICRRGNRHADDVHPIGGR